MSCSGDKKEPAGRAASADFLPAEVAAADLYRSADVRTFQGEALYEHIDGGAEVYHAYGFREVATAHYQMGETEIQADLYRFEDGLGAFGLYSMLRPPETAPAPYGREGFASPSSLDFVTGAYVVRLTGFDESPATATALTALADTLAAVLPSSPGLPEGFAVFPDSGAVPYRAKYYAESFLGQGFLSAVYTRDYALGSDTATFFWSQDDGKFERWSAQAEPIDTPPGLAGLADLPETNLMTIQHAFYGTVVAIRRGNILAGVIGYKDSQAATVTAWLEHLQ
jgi:hypothetical protein